MKGKKDGKIKLTVLELVTTPGFLAVKIQTDVKKQAPNGSVHQ